MKKTIKAWTEEIVALLDSRQDAVERGLLVIDAFQTESERHYGQTVHLNGVGWGGSDAEFGSSLARQVRENRSLSAKQLHFARKIVKKYRRQLVDVARGVLSNPMAVRPDLANDAYLDHLHSLESELRQAEEGPQNAWAGVEDEADYVLR